MFTILSFASLRSMISYFTIVIDVFSSARFIPDPDAYVAGYFLDVILVRPRHIFVDVDLEVA